MCIVIIINAAIQVVVVLIDIYYTIIIAWTLFYLIASFTALPSLPWAGCSKKIYHLLQLYYY